MLPTSALPLVLAPSRRIVLLRMLRPSLRARLHMKNKRGPSLEQLSKMRVGLLRRCASGCVYGYVRVRRRRDRHSPWGHADDCGMAAEMTELSVRLRMASGGKPWRGSRRGRDKDGRGAANSPMEARSPSHTRPTRQLVCEGSHSRS